MTYVIVQTLFYFANIGGFALGSNWVPKELTVPKMFYHDIYTTYKSLNLLNLRPSVCIFLRVSGITEKGGNSNCSRV